MSIFFKETDDKPLVKKAPMATVQSSPVVPVGNIEPGTDYVQYLNAVMDKSNPPGPDYYEFSKSIAGLITEPLSEQQKYTLTFNTYKTLGITVDQLCTSAGKYLAEIELRKNGFEKEMTKARQDKITSKQELITAKQQEIEDLKKQIELKTKEMGDLNINVNTETQRLAVEESAFQNAYVNKKAEINDHIVKINTYLNGQSTK